MVQQVPENINFPKEEEKILELWKNLNCFRECLKQSKNRPRFNFYDGPPFATGLPHYGHILAGTIKDIVTRFAHQSGFHVDRRFGWDCHGLPVEYEIDKTLGIKGPEDVAKMGIEEYNNQCRGIVMRYSKEWEFSVTRLGRWIDFENDYKTLYPEFMESVWWVFKQLYDKGLVYRGVKVMPFSTACNTPLSNFESHQNYKDVQDPAVTVSFPLDEDANISLLAWTTTPWTLPSNLALCVNPELQYVKLRGNATGKIYILMESRLIALYKSDSEYEILDRFPGIALKGKRYKPLFEYFIQYRDKGAFAVVVDSYVKEEEGTGIVHQAPYFGADDYRVCMDFNIIQKDSVPVCPVDASGCFTAEVTDFAGQYVKDADKNIIKLLKEKGRLVHSSSFKHSYPFCWRSDTPLIYKAVPSWFVRVEHMVEKLLENNAQCYWVPDFVREKRFGNWLKDARDWAISRNRYWGTPIPLWVSDDLEECFLQVVCIGSVAELEELSGVKVTDLHRESIDHLTIPSHCGKGLLHRVPEVFDCWFESGSMPYAQVHYPFENKKELEDAFPADFIAEGIDQTRGWFYTLLVLSTALFGRPPFKNVIVNGLVLASDGQKMSKRKKNYPDPMSIVNSYGADALRLYLINSPVVRAENLRFKEEGVRDILKDVFLPWYNAYRFLVQNVQILQHKGENGTEDCIMALETLFSVLFSMCRLMAPYTPFITELMYQNLKTLIDPASVQEKNTESIHYLMLPQVREDLIDKRIESAVSCLQSVIELGRVIRDRKTIPVKYPLKEVVVIHQDPEALENIRSLEKYILEELNVRQVTLSVDKEKYGVRLRAEPDHMVLGKRLKGAFKLVMAAIKELKSEQLEEFQETGTIVVEGHELHGEDLRLMYQVAGGSTQFEAHSDAQVLVLLDVTPDQSMVDEGVAREVINRIQKLRKKRNLVPTDEITVYYRAHPEGDYLDTVIKEHTDFIFATIKAALKPYPVPTSKEVLIQETTQLKGSELEITLVRGGLCQDVGPACAYVNLKVYINGTEQDGVLLLENPKGDNTLNFTGLVDAVSCIFGLKNSKLTVFNGKTELLNKTDLLSLSGKTLHVTAGAAPDLPSSAEALLCQYINLQLVDAKPQECQKGTVGTLLMENPVGKNGLTYHGLLHETAKVFGLRSRRLKLFLDEAQTQEITKNISMKNLNMKTLYVRVIPTTAEY
ncbi:isoleucine--tRNA ligase, cytoplasmic isoform X6 [Pezoporus flaviventris]|uniref:isoleucine--tRNA ligase, cytoplasmic isoform X6 n=1 Tax=Pezoporus flaviventris TaxID=889875 RepID=UPI002AAF69A4|nr:isoleucine--tRNA ligase, cytoplasmic isoform X6 [Pezoporus flaviventris]